MYNWGKFANFDEFYNGYEHIKQLWRELNAIEAVRFQSDAEKLTRHVHVYTVIYSSDN